MRIFLCGHELGLGFVIGQRLLADGHEITMLTTSDAVMANLAENKMRPVLGQVEDASVQAQLAKTDAVIDVELPNTLLLRKVRVARLRPYLLARALQGSGRPLIVTSSAAILGDTGPVPLDESARLRPLPGYAWLRRLEREVLKSHGVRSVVIRPAWELYGCRPPSWAVAIGNWMKLARRFRRGKYIGSGENRYSAVHFDDLADLYCVALKRACAGTVLHGASENFSIKELATTIHRSMGFKAEASSLSLEQARRFSPIADALIRSHALSGDLARSLGWQPSRDSIMKDVEQRVSEKLFVARLRLPIAECKKT